MTGFANIVSARQLRAARVMAGLTQRQLSIEAGFGKAKVTICRQPFPRILRRLSKRCGVTASKYLPGQRLEYA
jgi:transcriptional regulator with XRE-family HTH domain